MLLSDYWNALSSRQRIGLIAGAGAIVLVASGSIMWLTRDPYVPLAVGLSAERINEIAGQLDEAKLRYRIDENAAIVAVPRAELGKARAAAAGGAYAAPPSV